MPPQKTEVHAFTTYGYDPTLPSSSTVLGFNAERLDTGSESYVLGNGYRVFSPILMRFLSPDSLSPFDDGGINAYAYCSGDPINHLDPSGHAPPGKKNNSAGATTHKVTSAPSPSESPMTLRLNQLKQERAKLELDNPSLKEDKQKVLNYSFNNPGKLKEMHDLIHTTQSKNERTARGHWNSDAAFAQIVDAQVAETNLTSFYNSNPGIQEMYKLHYTTHKLDQKITSLDRKINSLENMIYVIRGSNT